MVGRRIRDLRTRCGWSKEELGLKSGLNRNYIGGIGATGLELSLNLRPKNETKYLWLPSNCPHDAPRDSKKPCEISTFSRTAKSL